MENSFINFTRIMFDQGHVLFLIFVLVTEQVSEQVERALEKLGPAKLNTGK